MAEYRLYVMDAEDHVSAQEPLHCRTAREAISAALARLDSEHVVELRRDGRLIGRFGGASTPARWPEN
jgi:hypothetical protein